MIHLAIDGMGGDHAPQITGAAVRQAVEDYPNLEVSYFADLDQVDQDLLTHERIHLVATSEVITGDDEPVRAIRRKKDSSMVRAARLVREGGAHGVVSAGNTGALLAAGLLIVGRIRGIDRPGLMPSLPTVSSQRPRLLMMDAGANAESSPENLHQFAYLAQTYAQKVLGLDHPLIALLNNGSEASKGDPLHQEAYRLLSEDSDLNFQGNIESDQLLLGQVDIVITDGFTGNAVLKTLEGTAKNLFKVLSTTLKEGNLKTKLGGLLVKDALKDMAMGFDSSQEGGAVLLGVRAPVIKAHGSSDQEAFYHAIRQGVELVSSGIIDDLTQHFEEDKK